jgi:Na+-translocating ferredoxin:NAD+ oxidoreductase subunit B
MTISIEQCESLLPQTNCRQCSYDGCNPYAAALVQGTEKAINRCRPGGQVVTDALAELFQVPTITLLQEPEPECTIVVNVDQCIGCTLCIQACPVDAIVGAAKMQHQVIEQECTGCQLCLPVCPTACMVVTSRVVALPTQQANRSKITAKKERQLRAQQERIHQHRASVERLDCLIKKGISRS